MRVIQVWFQNKRSKERRMKQMTSGMVAGRGFFPGKGGRRGFPLIGDEFGYFHDKPYHDFGYPNFPPPPEGFFPPGSGGPMGFLGPPGEFDLCVGLDWRHQTCALSIRFTSREIRRKTKF